MLLKEKCKKMLTAHEVSNIVISVNEYVHTYKTLYFGGTRV
jgi:hypothetical protein